jgi:hypothetical protein
MSPVVLRKGKFRFFFFSREEDRMHVHVYGAEGEAKIWLEPEPEVELAASYRFSKRDVNAILKIVVENQDALRNAWIEFFGRRGP